MIKAIVFDFDGLIVDTETVWFEVFKEVLQEYDCNLTIEDFAVCIGTTDEVLFRKINELAAKPIDPTVIKKKTRELSEQKMKALQLREGVADYLQSAKELGLKIGLASSSSKEWVEGYLERLNIREYFEVIKTSNDVKKVKPDPELYIQAIAELGVTGQDTLAFEDSKNGLIAALAAGLNCVIVPNSVTSFLDFSGHSYRLSSMAEMKLKDLFVLLDKQFALNGSL